MRKVQKLLLNVGAILLLIIAAVLVVQNMAVNLFAVQFLTWTISDLSLGLLLGGTALLLAGSVALKLWERNLSVEEQYKKTSRDLERKDVSREEAVEKVKVLENKVQTLEKALSEALKR